MKKIMFSDEFALTKAVLDGRKTQTRRLFTLTLHKETNGGNNLIEVYPSKVFFEDGKWKFEYDGYVFLLPKENYPRYNVGEVVAVAQSYRDCGGVNEEGVPMWEIISQKVDSTNAGWGNKMFIRADLMPHQIRITNVRIERLQDISEEDAIAEGITYAGLFYEDYGEPMFVIESCKQAFGSAKDAYAWLIDKISGKGTWQSNPYVFVYDFELIK